MCATRSHLLCNGVSARKSAENTPALWRDVLAVPGVEHARGVRAQRERVLVRLTQAQQVQISGQRKRHVTVNLGRRAQVVGNVRVRALHVVSGKFHSDRHRVAVDGLDLRALDVVRYPLVQRVELTERSEWSGGSTAVAVTPGSVGVDGANRCVQSHDSSSW